MSVAVCSTCFSTELLWALNTPFPWLSLSFLVPPHFPSPCSIRPCCLCLFPQLRFELATTALNVMELESEARRPAPQIIEAANEVGRPHDSVPLLRNRSFADGKMQEHCW